MQILQLTLTHKASLKVMAYLHTFYRLFLTNRIQPFSKVIIQVLTLLSRSFYFPNSDNNNNKV